MIRTSEDEARLIRSKGTVSSVTCTSLIPFSVSQEMRPVKRKGIRSKKLVFISLKYLLNNGSKIEGVQMRMCFENVKSDELGVKLC